MWTALQPLSIKILFFVVGVILISSIILIGFAVIDYCKTRLSIYFPGHPIFICPQCWRLYYNKEASTCTECDREHVVNLVVTDDVLKKYNLEYITHHIQKIKDELRITKTDKTKFGITRTHFLKNSVIAAKRIYTLKKRHSP
ncbi:hypothetical protein K1X76_00720 [bacterium]|nr:hypothetical protein [bacterium]